MSLKSEETKNIRVALVIEVIGTPKEHLTDTLGKLIKNIDEEKGVSVKSKNIKEPILMEGQKEFYTSFTEVEVEVENILYLAILLFKYMPAHIEIIEPELIALTNAGWNDILNELTRRLHGYDEVARILQFQNAQMQKKLKELTGGEEAENKENEKSGNKKENSDEKTAGKKGSKEKIKIKKAKPGKKKK